MHVIAHLAQKGRRPSEPGRRRQHIGGRAAGIALEKPHAAIGHAAVGEVDQQLAQGRDIVPGAHSAASGYSLHSRRQGGSSSSMAGKRPTGGLNRLSVLSSLHWLTSPISTLPLPGSTSKS